MERETDSLRLTPWIELISEAGDAHVRDRLLVECAITIGCARAAALWRPIGGMWREVIARGSADDLPKHAAFEALRKRELPSGAIGGTRVFAADAVALALGGVTCDDPRLDPIEALLHVFALVDTWSGTDALPAVLPRGTQPTLAVDDEEDRRLRHDLANVLTSLRATEDMLQKLGDGLSLADTKRFEGIVEHEVSRASDLLATAFVRRPLFGGTSCRPALVLGQVIDAERALNEEHGVTVMTYVEPGARAAVAPLTPVDMSRVVQNLLVNAREALSGRRPAHVWITLEVQSARHEMHFIVEDDGPGFDPNLLERVFEAGFSTKSTASDGQGLSIVKGLIEAAGGSIRARNRSSGGAAFDMTLPQSR